MMKFLNKILGPVIFLLVSGMFVGCDDDAPVREDVPLVVEGWIETGEAPVVIVTHAVDLTADRPSFDDVVEKWCRVIIRDVSTGREYPLTAHKNESYRPSFVFTTSRLKGKPGGEYLLTVETETDTVSAVTKILTSPAVNKISPERQDDGQYALLGYFSGFEPNGFYKIFVKEIGKDARFYPAFMATFRGSDYDDEKGVVITRGVHATYEEDSFSHYFEAGSTVMVRVARITEDIYNFWKVYDSNVSLSNNIFFTFTENCPGNIDGGLGYFAGYGSAVSALRLPVVSD